MICFYLGLFLCAQPTRNVVAISSVVHPDISTFTISDDTTKKNADAIKNTDRTPNLLIRELQSLPTNVHVDITDATKSFIPSTESEFDYEVELVEDNLSFHWNHDVIGDSFTGRLIHKSDSIEQAPSWLGFGIYHSNHYFTTLPTSNFMVGSTALVGLPLQAQAEIATPALHYHMKDKYIDSVKQIQDDASFSNAVIFQHYSDDGKVITYLTFTKSFAVPPSAAGPCASATLRREGTNVFLWAVGDPGAMGRFGKHAFKGVIFLDMDQVQRQVEGTSTSTSTSTPTPTSTSTSTISEGGGEQINTSPIIHGKCGSSILKGNDAGHVPLTPTLFFHWALTGSKIQIALQYIGREAWLGIASSKNGHMVGSSAVIGIPGGGTPKHYLLNNQDLSGITEDSSVILEDATISTEPTNERDRSTFITTLKFTKFINASNNDPVTITARGGGSLSTFLFAVGNDINLAYHEHRGSFRLNLQECVRTIPESEEETPGQEENSKEGEGEPQEDKDDSEDVVSGGGGRGAAKILRYSLTIAVIKLIY